MAGLLENIGTILTNIINWFGQIGSYLITNPIFQIILGLGIFLLIFKLILNIKDEMEARKLAIGIDGNLDRLKAYRNGR